jgi:hypothetical protein
MVESAALQNLDLLEKKIDQFMEGDVVCTKKKKKK